jgi:hypothetical protein
MPIRQEEIRQEEILQLEGQDLTGAQAVVQHQAHQGKIPKSAKATPEFSHLFGGERHDHPPRLPQAQTQSHGSSRPAITEGRSSGVAALEVRVTGGDLTSIVEAI